MINRYVTRITFNFLRSLVEKGLREQQGQFVAQLSASSTVGTSGDCPWLDDPKGAGN